MNQRQKQSPRTYSTRFNEVKSRKNAAECKALVSELKARGDYKDAAKILRNLGAWNREYCPLCDTFPKSGSATCTQCGIELV